MKHPWLTLLTISFITILTFFFYSQRLRPIEIKMRQDQIIQPGSIEKPTVTFVNPSIGPEEAKVTIIEFGDFKCEACREVGRSIKAVLERFPEEVRFVWKHLPNESAYPLSTPAAIAAQCAHQQQRFFDYYDLLFERQTFLSEQQFLQIAQDLELDVDSFEKCYQSRDTLPIVRKDYEEALGLGLIATPTIYVNDDNYVGALSTTELTDYVQAALNK